MPSHRSPGHQYAIDSGQGTCRQAAVPRYSEFGIYSHFNDYLEGCRPKAELIKGVGVVVARTVGRYDYEFGFDPITGDPLYFEISHEPGDNGGRSVESAGQLVLPPEIVIGEPLRFGFSDRQNVSQNFGTVVTVAGLLHKPNNAQY